MSAAEKLRALDEAMVGAPWFYEAGMADGMDRTGSVWARPADVLTLVMSKPHHNPAQELMALRNALPQIVALVEAAEQIAAMSSQVSPYESRSTQHAPEVARAALAALEAALT